MFLIIYLIVLFASLATLSSQQLKRVCYLKQEADIPIDYIIGTDLCSHIIVGFDSVVDNIIRVDDTNHQFYKKCRATLDALNSQTLLMISIGGKFSFCDFNFYKSIITFPKVAIMSGDFIRRLSLQKVVNYSPDRPSKWLINMDFMASVCISNA